MTKKLSIPHLNPVTAGIDASVKVTEAIAHEVGETKRERIRAESAVFQKKLDLAREGLEVIRAFFDLAKANQRLQNTRVEWEGRVEQARTELEKADRELLDTQEKATVDRQNLDIVAKQSSTIIELLNLVIQDLRDSDLPHAERMQLLDKGAEIAEKLTKLG